MIESEGGCRGQGQLPGLLTQCCWVYKMWDASEILPFSASCMRNGGGRRIEERVEEVGDIEGLDRLQRHPV